MKPSIRYSLLTLTAVLCVGVALSASRLRLPAFTQSAATPQQAAVQADDADNPATEISPYFGLGRNAVIQTDKAEYARGEVVIIRGSGWDPGETVTFLLHEEPAVHADRQLSVTADAAGNIFDNQFVTDGDRDVTFRLTAIGRSSGLRTQAAFGKPAANLDQCANGGVLSTPVQCKDAAWQNGNLNGNQAHYLEGQSVPYRAVVTSVTAGNTYTVRIDFDTTQNGKHALDYLTTFNASENDAIPCSTTLGSRTVPLLRPRQSPVTRTSLSWRALLGISRFTTARSAQSTTTSPW